MTFLASVAPKLLAPHWIDEAGQPRSALTLIELGSRHRIPFFYQPMRQCRVLLGRRNVEPVVDSASIPRWNGELGIDSNRSSYYESGARRRSRNGGRPSGKASRLREISTRRSPLCLRTPQPD